MSEHKRIVVNSYPVEKLPKELREGLVLGDFVKVTVELADENETAVPRPLASYLGGAPGVYSTPDKAVDAVRKLRDEWE